MSTTEERYGRATHSSHLQATEFAGDVDALIAAGWLQDGLGPMLWRLRAEFDGVSKQAFENAANPETGLLFAMMALRSLAPVRAALTKHALVTATRRKIMLNDAGVMKATGAGLQYWLHSACDHCTGRGVIGGYAEVQRICAKCNGTGKRRLRHPGKVEEECFDMVVFEIERKLDWVNRQMRRFLKQ